MEFQVVCPNDDAGCVWCGNLHDLENHLTCCLHRPTRCLYCQRMIPFNQLNEHTQICLSSMFENFLKLEEEACRRMYPLPQPQDEVVTCPNSDKCCTWHGREKEVKVHLFTCEMEEYRPSSTKRQRTY